MCEGERQERPGAGGRERWSTEPLGPISSLRSEWTPLAADSGNLFATWEWASAWWRHYGGGRRREHVLACRDSGGRTAAILPLCIERDSPVRIARFIGHGPADGLGPVCAPGDAPRALAALASVGGGRPRPWSVLLAERLPAEGAWARALPGRELVRESSPVIDLAGLDWDGYLATRSANFRSQVRRKERKLIREHGLQYRLCDDRQRLDADLDTLIDLHRRRWAGEGSGAFDGVREAFHRDFAALALEQGWLRLWIAELGGRPAAAWYGFRFAGSEWYYQFGRDPQWDASSLGLVLLAHTVREAVGDGIERYRLLRGGESYKDRFATADPGLVTVAVPSGAGGRVAVGAAHTALRLPPAIRGRIVARMR